MKRIVRIKTMNNVKKLSEIDKETGDNDESRVV